MGVYLELDDYENKFNMSRFKPFILNDRSTVTEKERATIERMTRTVYTDQDVYSNRPSCECGKLRDGIRLGLVCSECGKPVQEHNDQSLETRVWIRSPRGVAKLINPIIWTMLKEQFSKSSFNMIEWLCNTDYAPPVLKPNVEIEELLSAGVQRGYNNFVQNFDKYIGILSGMRAFANKIDPNFFTLIAENRDIIFSNYLPLPNQALLIIENNHSGRWMDPLMEEVFDAICNIQGIDTPTAIYSQRQRENRAVKTIAKLASYHYRIYHDVLARKQGLCRKQIYGSRAGFAGRAVISSNTGVHNYDEIQLSWGQGVTVFRVHLTNYLLKMGATPGEIAGFLNKHTQKYSKLLDDLFKKMFKETRDGRGFRVIFVRNPSLTRSSTQAVWITGVKTDIDDPTTTMSILAVVGFNAKEKSTWSATVPRMGAVNKCAKPSIFRMNHSYRSMKTCTSVTLVRC